VTPDRLKMVMEFEADRMAGLKLTDEAVLPERNVVLEEQNSRVANSPSAKLGEEIAAALYLNHPYGRPVIGWRHEIEKLDRKDAIDFYNRWYTPNNAVLVVAGDVTADDVKKLAEETYGKVAQRAEIGPRLRPQEPEQRAVRTVTFADPRVTQPSLQRSYLVPSAATGKPGESEALEILSQILGSGTNSRFYSKLVIEKPLATSVGAWYQGTALDWTRFGIYGTPRNEVTLKDLEESMDAVIQEVADKGVSNEELERAKIKLVSDVVYAQDSQATMARWYGGALTTGLTVDSLKTWPERVQKVTADDVQAAAKNWLDKRRSVTGYLVKGPAKPEERRS
jgi:zinc protease